MNKNELEYAKLKIDAEKHSENIGLIKHLLTGSAYVGSLWVVFNGLGQILVGQHADGISAIAKVIEALKLGSMAGYIWGAGATVAWSVERKSKKRALDKKNQYQLEAEAGEPNRSSSGLNKDGSTPKGA